MRSSFRAHMTLAGVVRIVSCGGQGNGFGGQGCRSFGATLSGLCSGVGAAVDRSAVGRDASCGVQ